ncbi:hypothetical protein SNEBB_000627 [Seison nebaliae]|nr:hypothetical protein SNEBB_000627 [Seison nebaliae]
MINIPAKKRRRNSENQQLQGQQRQVVDQMLTSENVTSEIVYSTIKITLNDIIFEIQNARDCEDVNEINREPYPDCILDQQQQQQSTSSKSPSSSSVSSTSSLNCTSKTSPLIVSPIPLIASPLAVVSDEENETRDCHTNDDIDRIIATLKKCQLISEQSVKWLCVCSRDILVREGNIHSVDLPVKVCGDIHGQFYDLIKLFEVGGQVENGVKYLFLGDFVDRGCYSVETFLLLLAFKVKYPERIFLIRGNHESRQITQVYGFYDECMKKYGSATVWRFCTETFDYFSLGAEINGKILCVHGGLSPSIYTLDDIRCIDRKIEVPHEGAMCDLLWSDPNDAHPKWDISPRGAGFLFGREIVESFHRRNGINLLCRAHQLIMEGYKWHFDKMLLTIWSAPNYCCRCGNEAAILELNNDENYSFIKFREAESEFRFNNLRYFDNDYFL